MKEEFFCRVFSGPEGRYNGPATVSLREGRLELVLAEGSVLDFSLDRITARLGGDTESQLVLLAPQTGEPDLELYLEDLGALEPLQRRAPEPLLASLTQVTQSRRRNRRRGWWWWMLVGGLLAGVACFFLFGLGFLTERAVQRIPPEWETQLGKAAVKQVLIQYPTVTEPVVMQAVETIQQRLQGALVAPPYEFQIHVVQSEEINAFALPGGQMVVFTGLLEAAETPEEVAGVLAHEFQHVLQRHGLKNLVQSLGIRVLLGALIGDSSALLVLLERSAEKLLTSRFSRQQETEADLEGVALLHRAHLSPEGMISFFERLAEEEGAFRTATAMVASHPLSAQRATRIRSAFAALPAQELQPLEIEWTEVRQRCQEADTSSPDSVFSPE